MVTCIISGFCIGLSLRLSQKRPDRPCQGYVAYPWHTRLRMFAAKHRMPWQLFRRKARRKENRTDRVQPNITLCTGTDNAPNGPSCQAGDTRVHSVRKTHPGRRINFPDSANRDASPSNTPPAMESRNEMLKHNVALRDVSHFGILFSHFPFMASR